MGLSRFTRTTAAKFRRRTGQLTVELTQRRLGSPKPKTKSMSTAERNMPGCSGSLQWMGAASLPSLGNPGSG